MESKDCGPVAGAAGPVTSGDTVNEPGHFAADEVLSEEMATILRAKTPTERLGMALQSWTFLRDLIRRTAAHQHPEWTQEQLDRHVAERMSCGTG